MRIKELAQAVHIPVETIRYYEKAGLMPPAARSGNNYRVYTRSDEERLRFIRNCRVLDMSLDEVRELINFIDQARQCDDDVSDCSGVRAVVAEHLGHVRSRLKSLKALEKQLSHLLKVCDHPESMNSCVMVQELFSQMNQLDMDTDMKGVHTT